MLQEQDFGISPSVLVLDECITVIAKEINAEVFLCQS